MKGSVGTEGPCHRVFLPCLCCSGFGWGRHGQAFLRGFTPLPRMGSLGSWSTNDTVRSVLQRDALTCGQGPAEWDTGSAIFFSEGTASGLAVD